MAREADEPRAPSLAERRGELERLRDAGNHVAVDQLPLPARRFTHRRRAEAVDLAQRTRRKLMQRGEQLAREDLVIGAGTLQSEGHVLCRVLHRRRLKFNEGNLCLMHWQPFRCLR